MRQVNNHQVISPKKAMNELFTFNSQQFQALQNPPACPPNFRKRIIRTSETKRQGSLFGSLSTSEGNRDSGDKLLKTTKKVSFSDSCQLGQEDNKSSPQSDRIHGSEEIHRKQQAHTDRASQASRPSLFKIFSAEMQIDKAHEKKDNHEKTDRLQEEDNKVRRQRRLRSFKLGPKVVMPLSDRKLPKVFKKGGENVFPPIDSGVSCSIKKEVMGLMDSRYLLSSDKRRVLFESQQELQGLGNIIQRNSYTPRV